MKLVKTIKVGDEFKEIEICNFPNTLLSSMNGLRMFLLTHAGRQWGFEGRDFSICNNPECLIPIYARNRHNGETLEIK